jgi:hypothetical protein
VARADEGDDENDPDNHWCEYHDHESEEAKKACKASRVGLEDPDVQWDAKNEAQILARSR